MAFAFSPDDAPVRVIRYVARGTLPGLGLRAVLDKKTNLLIIDKPWFDGLTPNEQRNVLRTQQPYIDTESRLAA